MELEEVISFIDKRQYDDAIAACNALLEESREKKIDVLRVRAYAYARAGEYQHALEDYDRIFEDEGVEIKDFYLAGFDAIYAAQFEKALDCFLEVLRLSKEQKENWFLSATLFYLSYVQMQLNEYGKAVEYLNEAVLVEADVAMPVPEGGFCNGEQLREEIERRAFEE